MIEEPDGDALLHMLKQLLIALVGKDPTDEQVIRFWFHLGHTIGIGNIFPYMKVVVTPDPERSEDDNAVVALLASPSEALVEVLSSQTVFKERVMDIVLEDYRTQRNKL